MDILKKIRYPKFFILILTFVLAYIIFSAKELQFIHTIISSSGYVGAFVSGILFSYSFTAGISTASFLILGKANNIFLTGIIGGLGALFGDYIIFKFIRHSLKDEVELMSQEKIIIAIFSRIHSKIKKTMLIIMSCIIIASPFPDELGIFILAATTKISERTFSAISYTLNTAGILIILAIGHSI